MVATSEVVELVTEKRENLMMQKVLLYGKKEVEIEGTSVVEEDTLQN